MFIVGTLFFESTKRGYLKLSGALLSFFSFCFQGVVAHRRKVTKILRWRAMRLVMNAKVCMEEKAVETARLLNILIRDIVTLFTTLFLLILIGTILTYYFFRISLTPYIYIFFFSAKLFKSPTTTPACKYKATKSPPGSPLGAPRPTI